MQQTSIRSTSYTIQAAVLVISLLLMSMGLAAQQTASVHKDDAVPAPGSAAPNETKPVPAKPAAQNEPLTLRDRLSEYRQSTFAPLALVYPAAVAGYDQLTNYPKEWQQGGEGYGKRLASSYGGLVIDNTISFGVAALDREDLHYVPSSYPKKAIFKRAGYAIAHTFVSRRDVGGDTFAWSRVAGAYGSGFIANEWFPERRSNLHNAVYLGTFNLAGDFGSNLLREFIRPQFTFGPKKNKQEKP